MNAREMRDLRHQLIERAKDVVDKPGSDYDAVLRQIGDLNRQIEESESAYPRMGLGDSRAGSFLHDSETRAMAAYIRGDRAALQDLEPSGDDMDFMVRLPKISELRAVDSIMNITTAADGGNVVPTGFAGQIAARMNEMKLSEKLGCRKVPGKGTTVGFPYENADPNQFATTAEQDDAHAQNYERDAAVFGSKDFTLVKKTKKLELTEELMNDEDAELMKFIADHVGRAIAATHNAMLLTEVASNGTALKTFASASAIGAGEPEDLVFHDTLGYYLDDGGSIGWVMRPTTHGAVSSITGNARMYENIVGAGRKELLNYPVYYSNSAAAIGASAKTLYFGNFWVVGYREDPALRLIRDPYSVDGAIILKYSFRSCYGVLIQGGVGYGSHPSA